VIPSEQYRGYLRFFLEMVLVLFCVQQFLSLGNSNIKQTWENSYQSFYREMEQRKQEAQDLEFLDEEYVAEFQTEEETVP
jgi:hypothetical protein